MEKVLLVDVDNVICSWELSFDQYVVDNGYGLKKDYHAEYYLEDRYHGSKEDLHELMVEFNSSKHISSLRSFKDSATYLPKLKRDGFTIIAITSIGHCKRTFNNRSDNFIRLFGRDTIPVLHCTELSKSKINCLRNWEGSGFMWVEDLPQNAIDGAEVGLHSHIIDHHYNQGQGDGIPRVSNDTPWYDLYHIISEYYSSP